MAKRSNSVIDQITTPIKKKKERRNRLLTGSTLRDIVLGGAPNVYGIPTGVIWNSIGVSGGGKTFLATEMIAVNRYQFKDKFKWVFDDAEGGNEVDSQSLYGFNIITEKMIQNRSRTIEQLHMNIKKFLKTLKPDDVALYVIDSLDALISDEVDDIIKEREKAFDKGSDFDKGSYFMEKCKYLKQQFFPDIKPLIEKSNCTLLIISQQSEKVGVTYGSKKDRAGGKALRFFSHYESWVRELEKIKITIKGEDRVMGARNIEHFSKTRNARPFRDCMSTIYFKHGVSDIDSNLDFVFNLLTDTGKDSTGKDSRIRFKDCSQLFKDEQEFFKIFKRKRILKRELDKIDEIQNDNESWWLKKEDLVEHIQNNDMEDQLKQMVIDKYEEIEQKAEKAVVRKKKY